MKKINPVLNGQPIRQQYFEIDTIREADFFKLTKINISNYKSQLIFSILFGAGIFYRVYNANFEDYWLDEIFGFWVSDPKLNLEQTLDRSFGTGGGQNLLFDFILKYFYPLPLILIQVQ